MGHFVVRGESVDGRTKSGGGSKCGGFAVLYMLGLTLFPGSIYYTTSRTLDAVEN